MTFETDEQAMTALIGWWRGGPDRGVRVDLRGDVWTAVEVVDGMWCKSVASSIHPHLRDAIAEVLTEMEEEG